MNEGKLGGATSLLTPLPNNVLLYERRGFRVVAEADAAERKLHLWLMRRSAGG